MIFKAYPDEQRDYRIIVITLTIIATLLLFCRIGTTIRNRGWLGLEDAFVIAANICLIVLASCMYTATTYGFGMRVADIKRTGGDIPHALKVSPPRLLSRLTMSTDHLVLLVDLVLLHTHKWLQQNGFPCPFLSRLPHEALSSGLLGLGCHLGLLDGCISNGRHLSV